MCTGWSTQNALGIISTGLQEIIFVLVRRFDGSIGDEHDKAEQGAPDFFPRC